MTNRTNAESRRSRTDKVKDKVEDAKETVQETASHLASEAREKGSDIAEEGREKAHEIGDKAQQIARSRADEQKQRVTNGIRTFADALRRGCDDLSTDQNQYRPLLTNAADRVEGVSRYLEQRDVDALTSDVRRFAREHTPLFIGGAFALGFAGARFLKSSPDRAYDSDSYQYGGPEGQARYDRMLPETGSPDRSGTQRTTGMQATGRTGTTGTQGTTGFEGRAGTAGTTGTSSFQDGGDTGGRNS
jgi:gas vesicle protein